jgi:hypothetical protein
MQEPKEKKELSAQEQEIVNAINASLEAGFHLKSTVPQKKCIDGQTHFTMWVEKDESKERFLVFQKNDGNLKYLSEETVSNMKKAKIIKNL